MGSATSATTFTDKVVVITGGSSGIGLAAARGFAAGGARVVLLGRQAGPLEAARAELGDRVVPIVADVSVVADLERAMAETASRLGGIDVLFANAGMSECPPLADTDAAFFDHLMRTNVAGVFFAFTRALPRFRPHGCAIFTATATHARARPGDPLYLASKAAVRSLARSLAVDPDVVAKHIRVNVVSPGATETPLTVAAHGNAEVRSYVDAMVPLGRWGQASEVADAVLFLASPAAAYITGIDLPVDGGLSQ